MKNLFLFLLLALSAGAYAQDFFYLQDIELREKHQYKDNEKEMLKAVDYLLSTPFDETNRDRNVCLRFVARFASGTPDIMITMEGDVVKTVDKNPDLIILYMGIYMKEFVTKPGLTPADYNKLAFAGLYKYAKAGNNLKKTKGIKDLIKAGDENNLDGLIDKLRTGK
jgi:hypothetical protein